MLQVGDYVVAAVSCFAFGEQVPIIDANVKRLVTRIFGCDKREVPLYARGLLPDGWAAEWNYALLDLGAVICGVKPICGKCPLISICTMSQDGGEEE